MLASFLLGVIFGVASAIFALIVLLTKTEQSGTSSKNVIAVNFQPAGDTSSNSSEAILETAVKSLQSIKPLEPEKSSIINVDKIDLSISDVSSDCNLAERRFNEEIKLARERDKQLKGFLSFFADLSKCVKLHQKELMRLSCFAATFTDSKQDVDNSIDLWWAAIAQTLESLALDQQSFSESISTDISRSVTQILETHSTCSKRFQAEGSGILVAFKEASSAFEGKQRERDKSREKLTSVAEKSSSSAPSSISALSLGAVDQTAKYTMKLEIAERALSECSERLVFVKKEFNSVMPKVMKDLHLTSSSALSELEKLLLKFANSTLNGYGQIGIIVNSLKENVLRASSLQIDSSSRLATQPLGYESMLRQWPAAAAGGASFDHHSESAATLAAAPPSRLSCLPPSIADLIDNESCLWFNAFSGRIYRDIGESEYFHKWFATKMGNMLNKGPRPDYIDAFDVVSVEFGELPPLLYNVRWTPLSKSNYNIECTGDLAFRSGIKIKIATKLWCNWPRDRYASISVVLELEVSEVCGRIRFGVDKGGSFVSFLEEPHTRFKVHSEVGMQYKLKDVPKLSGFVIKKIKELIRKKVVHPNCHKFRLIWPRNWWPKGTENNFLPPKQNSSEQGLVGGQATPSQSVQAALDDPDPAVAPLPRKQSVSNATECSDSCPKPSAVTTDCTSTPAPAPAPAPPARGSTSRSSSVRGTISNWMRGSGRNSTKSPQDLLGDGPVDPVDPAIAIAPLESWEDISLGIFKEFESASLLSVISYAIPKRSFDDSYDYLSHWSDKQSRVDRRIRRNSDSSALGIAPLLFHFVPTSLDDSFSPGSRRNIANFRHERSFDHNYTMSRFQRSWSISDFRDEYFDAMAKEVFFVRRKNSMQFNYEAGESSSVRQELMMTSSQFSDSYHASVDEPAPDSGSRKFDWISKLAKDKYSKFRAKHFSASEMAEKGAASGGANLPTDVARSRANSFRLTGTASSTADLPVGGEGAVAGAAEAGTAPSLLGSFMATSPTSKIEDFFFGPDNPPGHAKAAIGGKVEAAGGDSSEPSRARNFVTILKSKATGKTSSLLRAFGRANSVTETQS